MNKCELDTATVENIRRVNSKTNSNYICLQKTHTYTNDQ